jgi:hypothetical protein
MTMSDNGWVKGEGNHWSFMEWMRGQLTLVQLTIHQEMNERVDFANRNRLIMDQISLISVNRITAVGRK